MTMVAYFGILFKLSKRKSERLFLIYKDSVALKQLNIRNDKSSIIVKNYYIHRKKIKMHTEILIHRRKAIITNKIYRIPEMLPFQCIKHNGTNKYSYKAFSSFLRHIDCCF